MLWLDLSHRYSIEWWMIKMAEDNVTKLPIRFKNLDRDKSLEIVHYKPDACTHHNQTYMITESEESVECGTCGTKLSPLWVLRQLALQEMKWHETRARYHEEMKRLGERSRTTCQHCGKMTKISRS